MDIFGMVVHMKKGIRRGHKTCQVQSRRARVMQREERRESEARNVIGSSRVESHSMFDRRIKRAMTTMDTSRMKV